MSFETSKKRVVEPARLAGTSSARPDQPVSKDGALPPSSAPENALDSQSMSRLREFFELLDKWDRGENADEE